MSIGGNLVINSVTCFAVIHNQYIRNVSRRDVDLDLVVILNSFLVYHENPQQPGNYLILIMISN